MICVISTSKVPGTQSIATCEWSVLPSKGDVVAVGETKYKVSKHPYHWDLTGNVVHIHVEEMAKIPANSGDRRLSNLD